MSSASLIVDLRKAVAVLAPECCAASVAAVEPTVDGLSSQQRAHIQAWAPHRQHEFAAGRRCAERALACLGATPGALGADAEGVPQWPQTTVGSISHSRGVAVAVVARSQMYSLLGVDLEKTNRLSERALQRVVHSLEETTVAGDQGKASVLFSLKEAFYKAQFPRWRTGGNFHDLALAVDWNHGTAKVREIDARFAPELTELRFAFRLVDDYVVSLCWK